MEYALNYNIILLIMQNNDSLISSLVYPLGFFFYWIPFASFMLLLSMFLLKKRNLENV